MEYEYEATMTSDEDDREPEPERPPPRPLGPPPHEHEERRVDNVKLLLDAERPVVQQGRGWCLCNEVIGVGGREMEVGQEEGGPPAVDCGLTADGGADERRTKR